MAMTRKSGLLIASLTFSFLLTAFVLTGTGDSNLLQTCFERHPEARRAARAACSLVGLEDEFDQRFGGFQFYVRFTN
ncbi:MAG TPA: hypothetical protein VM452_19470 [Caulifigura sp.]|nr:hypothetical protein [Caulifigura sp.]